MFHLYTEEELQQLKEDYIEKVRRENWDAAVDEMLSERKEEYFKYWDGIKEFMEQQRNQVELSPEEDRKIQDCYDLMDDAWADVEKTVREAAEKWFRSNKELRRKHAERRKEMETNVLAAARIIARKKKRQIAKRILAKQVMTFKEIAECVGLPVAEIEKLAEARQGVDAAIHEICLNTREYAWV